MKISLDMCHAGLGTLDEYGLMVLFGNAHSRFLTEGLPHHANEIRDAKGNVLYPAYFMTELRVPAACAFSRFGLWDEIWIETEVKRYGDTILDSTYRARREEQAAEPGITMHANSLFILDPSIHRSRSRQVSVPRAGAVREMEKLAAPPPALQESSKVRAVGFDGAEALRLVAEPYRYTLEFGRDTSPGHPLLFAKMPLLMELSERQFLRCLTDGRISEEILQAVSLLERKTFYYGNAFAGQRLTLYTRGAIAPCTQSLWKENPKLQYVYRLVCETEMYKDGELLALSRSHKVVVHEIRDQALIQDTRRLLQAYAVRPALEQAALSI